MCLFVQMVILFNKWFFIVLLTGLISYSGRPVPDVHPYHVSATEIEYIAGERKVEISSRIFTDDFEAVLSKLYKARIDFSNAAMKKEMNEWVKKYISTHLIVRSAGKGVPLTLFGWEQDHEAINVYTTAIFDKFDTKNITVENTILYDQFDDQLNIIHFIVEGKRKSTKLNYPDRKAVFSF